MKIVCVEFESTGTELKIVCAEFEKVGHRIENSPISRGQNGKFAMWNLKKQGAELKILHVEFESAGGLHHKIPSCGARKFCIFKK